MSPVTKLHNKKSAGTVVAGFDYVYDKANRRTAKLEDVLKADASRAQHTIYYEYDKASQLTAENRRLTSDLSLVYSNYFTYDGAGNRAVCQRVETGKDEATYYTYDDADELTRHMKADVYTYFTYDDDGNQTSKKVGDSLCYYNYDPDNMLTTFTEGETEAEYVYDASPGIRRRVKAVVDGTVTYYAFDGLNVLADYDGGVSAQRTYVVPFLDDSLLLCTAGNDYHYTLDALGSVANLVDGNEAVQNDYVYEAFGSAHGTPTQNVTNRLRYTGREWEPTPSLYQYRARFYAEGLGRFLTRDHNRQPHNPPRYQYTENNPANYADPTGEDLTTILFLGLIGAVILGAWNVYEVCKCPQQIEAAKSKVDKICRDALQQPYDTSGQYACALNALKKLRKAQERLQACKAEHPTRDWPGCCGDIAAEVNEWRTLLQHYCENIHSTSRLGEINNWYDEFVKTQPSR